MTITTGGLSHDKKADKLFAIAFDLSQFRRTHEAFEDLAAQTKRAAVWYSQTYCKRCSACEFLLDGVCTKMNKRPDKATLAAGCDNFSYSYIPF